MRHTNPSERCSGTLQGVLGFARRCCFLASFGAATLLVPMLASAGPSPTDASPAEAAQAQQLYLAGVEHYKAGRLPEALEKFRASFDVVASPNSHLMIARVLKDQGKLLLAREEYDAARLEALALAPSDKKYADSAESARKALDELAGSLAAVKVNLTGGTAARVSIGGRDIPEGARGEPAIVEPGKVRIVVVTEGGRTVTRDVVVAAGDASVVALDLATAAPPASSPASDAAEESSGTSLVPVVVAGAVLGAAGFAVFGALGAMNDATYADLEANCPNDRCPANQQSLIDTGRTQQLVANIGLGVGAVGFAAAATFLIIELTGSSDDESAAASLVLGPGSFALRGSF